MVFVSEKYPGLAEGIQGGLGILSKALQDKQKNIEQQNLLNSILQKSGSNSQPEYTDEEIIKISVQNPELGRMLQQQKMQSDNINYQQQKLDIEKEKISDKSNEKLFDKVDNTRDNIAQEELALLRIEDALQSGEINKYTDWLAGQLGFEPGKKSEAQVLESAAKELFVKGLQGITGVRFNQFLERMLREAGANVGKSPEANQEYLESMYMISDIKKKYVEEFDKLQESYEKRGLPLPKNAKRLISEKLKPYEKQKLREYQRIKKQIREGNVLDNEGIRLRQAKRLVEERPPKEGFVWVLPPTGKAREIPISQVGLATQAGGKIVEQE